jgi:hypothetical protein
VHVFSGHAWSTFLLTPALKLLLLRVEIWGGDGHVGTATGCTLAYGTQYA